MQRKLGCRPAERRAGQPRLSGLRMMARKAPARLVRDHIDPAPLLLGNDRVGDCTSVGLGNHIRATAALAGFQVAVTEQDALHFYSLSTGYDPARPITDQGSGSGCSGMCRASRICADHADLLSLMGHGRGG